MENQKGKQLKYVQLMADLKEKILSGEIQPGEKIPSENILAAQYQVSRQTVRKVIAIMENEGYVYAEHGRGTFCTELFAKFREFQIPCVFIQGCYEQMKQQPQVLMDDCKGGYLITRHLIGLGHRNIIGVFKADDTQGQNRHKGYAKALGEAGIAYDPEKVIWFHTEDRTVHPYEKICQMIRETAVMDGIVCYNDQIAWEVIRALQDSGLRVPEDISVCGYDDSSMALSGNLRLTTITHPQEKLGVMAAELLLRLIHGEENGEKDRIMIEPELVEGNSCKDRKNNL